MRKMYIITIIFVIIVLSIMGYSFYYASRPSEYTISNGALKISGMYGEEIRLKDINSIMLKEQIPEILIRTNGSSLGNWEKGNFKLKIVGQTKLFISISTPPFIFINTNSESQ